MKNMKYILSYIVLSSISTVFASSIEVELNHLNYGQDDKKEYSSKRSHPFTEEVLAKYRIVINNKNYKIHLNDSILNELNNGKDTTKDMMEKTLTNLSNLNLPSTFQGFILSMDKNGINYTPISNRPFR